MRPISLRRLFVVGVAGSILVALGMLHAPDCEAARADDSSGARFMRWERYFKSEPGRLICRYLRSATESDTAMRASVEVRSRSYRFKSASSGTVFENTRFVATLCPPVELDQPSAWSPEFPRAEALRQAGSLPPLEIAPAQAAYALESHPPKVAEADCLEAADRLFFGDSVVYQNFCRRNRDRNVRVGLRRCLHQVESRFIARLENRPTLDPPTSTTQSFCMSLFRLTGADFKGWVERVQSCDASTTFRRMVAQKDSIPFRNALFDTFGSAQPAVESALAIRLRSCAALP